MIDVYTGKKIVSPLDFSDSRTEESKKLIAAGILSSKDSRNAIYLDSGSLNSELVGNLLHVVPDVEKLGNSNNSATISALDKVEPKI